MLMSLSVTKLSNIIALLNTKLSNITALLRNYLHIALLTTSFSNSMMSVNVNTTQLLTTELSNMIIYLSFYHENIVEFED